jgi:hypothetical protein
MRPPFSVIVFVRASNLGYNISTNASGDAVQFARFLNLNLVFRFYIHPLSLCVGRRVEVEASVDHIVSPYTVLERHTYRCLKINSVSYSMSSSVSPITGCGIGPSSCVSAFCTSSWWGAAS